MIPIYMQNIHVVVVDYGVKYNILRSLKSYGCRVTVVPADTTYETILSYNPDGICLSNGPGDPQATYNIIKDTIHQLLEKNIPILGICLGHQILALSLGFKIEKMPYGHRGANHPVSHPGSHQVSITSQNHGFVVSDSLQSDTSSPS